MIIGSMIMIMERAPVGARDTSARAITTHPNLCSSFSPKSIKKFESYLVLGATA